MEDRHDQHAAHSREHSRVARLQQGLVMGAIALAMLWAVWMWRHSHMAVVAGIGLLLLGYALVLGAEMAAAAFINRTDDAPRAGVAEWLNAWWQEAKLAPLVFAWRQPFRWRRWPDTAHASQGSVAAVVLVHGFLCNRGFWLPWMKRLHARDIPYVSVNLEPIFGSIDDYVSMIDAAVHEATALTGLPPTLICHSMGGLAARAWMAATPGAATRVHKIITIGTPHRGTWLARFSRLDNGRQMRYDCDWQTSLVTRELEQHPQRNAHQFVCWYSNTDNIVFPASTATLPGADNRLVMGAAHVALAFHPRVMEESLEMVSSADKSPSARTAS